MRRREFVGFLPAGLMAAAHPAFSQATGKRVQVGVLITSAPPHPLPDALRQGMRGLGYVEGENIAFVARYADGSSERAAELAQELVRLGVDVIVASQTPAARAAKEATPTVPIVMGGAGAPVETGLVASLNRPGGNITGVTDLAAELGPRRLQFLKDIVPNLTRVAALASSHDLFTRPFLQYMESAAAQSGLGIEAIKVSDPAEFELAFASMALAKAQAVVIQGIFNPKRSITLHLAARHHLPVVTWDRDTTAAGGLFSLSADRSELFQRTAALVDKILKGAKPSDLPVEQPTTYALEINLKTARSLGLIIPRAMVIQATEVFE